MELNVMEVVLDDIMEELGIDSLEDIEDEK